MNIRTILGVTAAMLSLPVLGKAQNKPAPDFPDFEFKTVKENPITSVKNQASSGTCWCFSGMGFVESEIIRINGITDTAKYPDFSEFFVVGNSYKERAVKYVRLDGALGFSAGSSCDDVLHVIRDYGLVPQNAMEGMNYGSALPKQSELDKVLKSYVEAVASNPNRTLTTAWKRGFDAVVDEYFGEAPETFTVDGKDYTPAEYRDSFNFNPDDYVSISSFTHHPFYTQFVMEVCDNWRWDSVYNVPLDEMMQIISNAIDNGYTIAWGADVSEPGFTRKGLGIFVDVNAPKAGSDQEHWVGKDAEAKKPAKSRKAAQAPVELVPSQEQRQNDFDRKLLTDDHGMQIFGKAVDQFGGKYYMVKNSWGTAGDYNGIWYISENFVAGRTMDLIVHKDAIPAEIRVKLGIR